MNGVFWGILIPEVDFMISDVEMLQHLCQGAEMGRDSASYVLEMSDNDRFREALKSQIDDYQRSYEAASKMLQDRGGAAEAVNPMAKAMAHVSSSVKTLTDHSPSKIAEMMIQGNTMGITTLVRHMNEYGNGDPAVTEMAKLQVEMEQENIEEMKKFL